MNDLMKQLQQARIQHEESIADHRELVQQTKIPNYTPTTISLDGDNLEKADPTLLFFVDYSVGVRSRQLLQENKKYRDLVFQAKGNEPLYEPSSRIKRYPNQVARGWGSFFFTHSGEILRAFSDSPVPYAPKGQEHGSMLSSLLSGESIAARRYEWWLRRIVDGDRTSEKPQIQFYDQDLTNPLCDRNYRMLLQCLRIIDPTLFDNEIFDNEIGRNRHIKATEAFHRFLDWILWGLGHPAFSNIPFTPEEADIHNALIQVFEFEHFYTYPGDRLGDLAYDIGLVSDDNSPQISFAQIDDFLKKEIFIQPNESLFFLDPIADTGKMLLAASNYTNIAAGFVTDTLCAKIALVNLYLYAPELLLIDPEEEFLAINLNLSYEVAQSIAYHKDRNQTFAEYRQHGQFVEPAGFYHPIELITLQERPLTERTESSIVPIDVEIEPDDIDLEEIPDWSQVDFAELERLALEQLEFERQQEIIPESEPSLPEAAIENNEIIDFSLFAVEENNDEFVKPEVVEGTDLEDDNIFDYFELQEDEQEDDDSEYSLFDLVSEEVPEDIPARLPVPIQLEATLEENEPFDLEDFSENNDLALPPAQETRIPLNLEMPNEEIEWLEVEVELELEQLQRQERTEEE